MSSGLSRITATSSFCWRSDFLVQIFAQQCQIGYRLITSRFRTIFIEMDIHQVPAIRLRLAFDLILFLCDCLGSYLNCL